MYINYIELLFCVQRGLHMSDTSSIINNIRFDSAVATSSADVVVKGFSDGALRGILEAIARTNSVISGLQSRLDEIRSDSDKRGKNDEKNKVASLANERKNRATEAAIHGEIKKGNVFNKMLRDGLTQALDGLTSFLKDNLKQSLKSMQNLSAIMRKANLSKADKDAIQLKAGSAITDVYSKFNNLKVDHDEVNDYLGDLLVDGKDITAMTAEQTASYIALRKGGIDADKAYVAAMTSSAKDLEGSVNALRKQGVGQVMKDVANSLDPAQVAAMGGWAGAMKSITKNTTEYTEKLKMSGVATGEAAKLVTGYTMAQHGMYDQLDDQQKNMAVFYKGTMAETADALKNASETLKIGARTDVLSKEMANIALMTDAGVNTGMKTYTDDEVGENNRVNTDKGMARVWFDEMVAGFDNITGGMVSGLTNRLDELFGDDADIVSITDTGFKIVTGLLGSLILANSGLGGTIISGISALLSGGSILSLIGGALKSLGSFLLKGAAHIISKIPALAAIAAAAATIYGVYNTLTDTIDRNNNLENAEKELEEARKNQADLTKKLEIAQKSGDAEAVAKYSMALAEVNRKFSEAEKNYQEAERKRSVAHETSENYADSIQKKNELLDAKYLEYEKLAEQAAALGDAKAAAEYSAKLDEIRAERKINLENVNKVARESENGLTSYLSAFLNTFGVTFSAEAMLGWANFKEGFVNFFTKDIPDAFHKLYVQPWIDMGNLINDSIIQPVKDAISEIGNWLDENVVQPFNNLIDTVGNWLTTNIVEPFKNFFSFNWLPAPIKKFIFEDDYSVGDMAIDLGNEALDKGKEMLEAGAEFMKGLWPFADGGIVNQATPAVVGEAGKEAVLPLTKPDRMLELMNMLTPSERENILRSLISSKDFSLKNIYSLLLGHSAASTSYTDPVKQIISGSSTVPGDDPATIDKILSYAGPFSDLVYNKLLHGWKGNYKDAFKQREKWYSEALANAANQEGRDLIRGTYAEKALEFGVSELGKPYILRSLGKIGYVCNELVNACLKASGFDMKKFRINGVRATFANIQKGKMSGEDYPNFRIRDDLTPETATPGMLFFQDSRKNKEGGFQPGHIGLVYYGNQKLHASGGSSDYTKAGFLPNWQTPCRGVTVTPFDSNSYVIGELPGLFEKISGTSEGFKFDNSYGPLTTQESTITDDLDKFINRFIEQTRSDKLPEYASLIDDYKSAMKSVKDSSSNEAKQAASKFSETAAQLLMSSSGGSSRELLASLNAMIKYLRDIASSPANKKVISSAARPVSMSY